ncbi:MAG: hypothetical protein E4G74_03930 [Erysipelotrichales bacterium]|nr:MAG: hypothetical protein E4G74_03930 [Erysipelotrichales bacterium]
MKIQLNQEIENYFQRCLNHILNDRKNEFLGMHVDLENQLKIQRKMKRAGFQEFRGPEEAWPSLFISTQDYLKSPYSSHIKLEKIEEKGFRLTRETVRSNELFSVSAIHPDENRELDDWMTLRALDQPYEATFLWQGEEVWMLDAPSEANTMDPYAKKARGNVLTFGLGIGYFIYMSALNPEVKSITIIERSPSVIEMFKKHLLPQFPDNIPITIIQGDAFDYFNKAYMDIFDYAFVDIWQSNDDGFLLIELLLEQYLPDFDKVDFWIESSCFEFMSALIFTYFNALAHRKPATHQVPHYHRLLRTISRYFDGIDQTISEVSKLKQFMYDPQLLRSITSIKL